MRVLRWMMMAAVAFGWAIGAEAGVVAYFPMNEPNWTGPAPQVGDTSGNGHSGTVVGGANTVASSLFGQVGNFNGSGQYVDVGGTGSISGARTVVAWVDVVANSQSLGQPILVGGSSGAGDFFGISGTGGENSGLPQYELYIDHWNTAAYHSGVSITPGQWTQVAFTFDGASTFTFYINGQSAGTYTNSNGLYSYNINSYTIAGNTIGGTTTAGSFDGQMSQLSLYNTALTGAQIQSLYVQALAPEPGGLLLMGAGLAGTVVLARSRRRPVSPSQP